MNTIDNLELKTKKVRVPFPYDSKLLNDKDVAFVAQKLIGDAAQEHFLVFLLDVRGQVIGYSTAAVGGLNTCPVDIRVVFRAAVLSGANSIICVHNHPSQYVDPSQDDYQVTQRIRKAGDVLGITLLDHLVVSKTEHTSLRSTQPGLFA
jgi:DNA repair protein RadC